MFQGGKGWGETYVKSWLKFISYPCLEQDVVAAPDEEDDVILVDVADDDDIIHTQNCLDEIQFFQYCKSQITFAKWKEFTRKLFLKWFFSTKIATNVVDS